MAADGPVIPVPRFEGVEGRVDRYKNHGGDRAQGKDPTPAQLRLAHKMHREWKWGDVHTEVHEWHDADYPPAVVGCGRLAEVVFDPEPPVRPFLPNPRPEPELDGRKLIRIGHGAEPQEAEADGLRWSETEAAKKARADSHLVFDPEHPHQRLYVVFMDDNVRHVYRRLYGQIRQAPVRLGILAHRAPGRHAKLNDYPDVMVKPLGTLYEVVYTAYKVGDGVADKGSFYFHHMGEENGKRPILAVDAKGRLWIAGGDYTAPPPGVTN